MGPQVVLVRSIRCGYGTPGDGLQGMEGVGLVEAFR